jgi:acetylornithine deacetylase/succinyl-diaminopimelate desuccinylase-like protein
VPTTPKVTFNVGVINGGTSVNSIPFAATMEVDMRSENADALGVVDQKIRVALLAALDAENARWPGERAASAKLSMVIDTMGIRPTGGQSDTAPIVQVALQTARSLGFTPNTEASSTDANIPIALGLPGITIDGGGVAVGSHSLNEWYEDGPNGWLGPQWVALIVARLAGLDLPRP